jgi:uncharacterized oligopeptide transporter (OPT) family protein
MKLLSNRRFKRLTSNKGELIVETLISFLVLAILITTVFLVLNRAISMTTDTARSARISQEGEVNPVMMGVFANEVDTQITFAGPGIMVNHPIIFNTEHAAGACAKWCPEFPGCPAMPCPDCCGCNSAVAFLPAP